MATLTELYDLLEDPAFRKRISMALYQLAVDVLGDDAASDVEKRWANAMMADAPQALTMREICVRVVADVQVRNNGDAATDRQILDAVSALRQILVRRFQ